MTPAAVPPPAYPPRPPCDGPTGHAPDSSAWRPSSCDRAPAHPTSAPDTDNHQTGPAAHPAPPQLVTAVSQQPAATSLQPQQLVQLQQQAATVQQVRQTNTSQQFVTQQQQQQQQPQILRQPTVQTIQTPVAPQRRNLSLTKEQMLEAQEMFRTANKVTRP